MDTPPRLRVMQAAKFLYKVENYCFPFAGYVNATTF
jgi:hypothetical protein